jgi:hypothetical protein
MAKTDALNAVLLGRPLAAARAFAAEFHTSRNAEYLHQIVDHPGSRRIDERYRKPDRTKWRRANQS